MASFKPLMPSKMRSMAAAAAAELAAIAAAPQTATLVAGTSKQMAASINLQKLIAELEGRIGRSAVTSLAFNPNATLLVAGTADWRLAGWALAALPPATTALPRGFTINMPLQGTAALNNVAPPPTSISLVSAFELSGAHSGAIHSVGILGDGTVLYTSGSDSMLRLWQVSKLLPASPNGLAVESETSIGALHPASIAMVCKWEGRLIKIRAHAHRNKLHSSIISCADQRRRWSPGAYVRRPARRQSYRSS
jgi:WD40 repeat protein